MISVRWVYEIYIRECCVVCDMCDMCDCHVTLVLLVLNILFVKQKIYARDFILNE